MKTEFTYNSPVGEIYQAVQAHCLAQGKSAEVCDAELHTGYVDNVTLLPLRTHLTDTQTAGEVLERAYQFEDVWPILAKHHFPIPFADTDFDPTTSADAEYAATLRGVADAAVAAAVANGLPPESDEFCRSVGKALFDWGGNNLTFFDDCPEESPGWLAWKNRCGLCTEHTYIMYRLAQQARLDPVFLHVKDPPPTLDAVVAHERQDEKFRWGEHVCIGIPLANGDLLQIDVLWQLFDAKHPAVLPLTPRQAVAEVWYANRQGELLEKEPPVEIHAVHDLARATLAVAPKNFLAAMALCGLQRPADTVSRIMCASLLQVYAGHPLLSAKQVLVAVPIAVRSGTKEKYLWWSEKVVPTLQALANISPSSAGTFAILAARDWAALCDEMVARGAILSPAPDWQEVDLQKFLRQFRKETMQLLCWGLQWAPEFMAGHFFLAELAMRWNLLKEGQACLAKVAQRHPTAAAPRYYAAMLALVSAQSKLREAAQADLQEANELARGLASLEPGHPRQVVLQAELLRLQGRFNAARALLESAAPRVDKDPLFWRELGMLHLQMGNPSQWEAAWLNLLKKDPVFGWAHLHEALREFKFSITGKDREPPVGFANVVTKKQRDQFLNRHIRIARALWERARGHQKGTEMAAGQLARVGVAALMANYPEGWTKVKAILPQWGPYVRSVVAQDVADYGLQFLAAPAPKSMAFRKIFLEPAMATLEASLGSDPALARLYFAFAKQYLWLHDVTRARQWLFQANAIATTVTATEYFPKVIQHLAEAEDERAHSPGTLQSLVDALQLAIDIRLVITDDQRRWIYNALEAFQGSKAITSQTMHHRVDELLATLKGTENP